MHKASLLLLTLLVTPVAYSLFDDLSKVRLYRRRTEAAPVASVSEPAQA